MPREIYLNIDGARRKVKAYKATEFSVLYHLNLNTLKAYQVRGHAALIRDIDGVWWIPVLYDKWLTASAGKPSPIKRTKKDKKATPGPKQNAEIMEILKTVGGSRQ